MVIVVHGGIYRGKMPDVRDVLDQACQAGSGKDCARAVENAVKVLEDDPRLDAGTGSYPNLLGEVEMSASIMTSEGKSGAVAAIKNIKNPVSIARAVMDHTPHLLLVGEGAVYFASFMGFPPYNPVGELTVSTLKQNIERAEKDPLPIYTYYLEHARRRLEGMNLGTVGAVAWERDKGAAATSTGGVEMQLPGRVGDTPLIGSGTFACMWGAVSMTGDGEGIVNLGLARRIAEWMKEDTAEKAVDKGMVLASREKVCCGAIAIDRFGRVGHGENGGTLSWAWQEV